MAEPQCSSISSVVEAKLFVQVGNGISRKDQPNTRRSFYLLCKSNLMGSEAKWGNFFLASVEILLRIFTFILSQSSLYFSCDFGDGGMAVSDTVLSLLVSCDVSYEFCWAVAAKNLIDLGE